MLGAGDISTFLAPICRPGGENDIRAFPPSLQQCEGLRAEGGGGGGGVGGGGEFA